MKFNLILQTFVIFLIGFLLACSDDEGPSTTDPGKDITKIPTQWVETFTINSNGKLWKAKIHISGEYNSNTDEYSYNKDLPAIYLVDTKEVSHAVAYDEFETVVAASQLGGLNVLVITLEDFLPYRLISEYEDYSDIFHELASYIEANYSSNPSRTLIGRGTGCNMVLATLFLEEPAVFQNFIATTGNGYGYFIELMRSENFPQEKDNKKLYFALDGESDYDFNMRFINTINEKAYSWLEFKWAEYPDYMYTTSYPYVYADGIKYIFEE